MAGRIVRLATEQGAPYLVEVPQPEVVLWANRQGDSYLLTLDAPYRAITVPELTWANWFDLRGVDAENRVEVREHLIEWNCFDPDAGEPFSPPHPMDAVPHALQEHYLEWDFASREAPTARTYQYLQKAIDYLTELAA